LLKKAILSGWATNWPVVLQEVVSSHPHVPSYSPASVVQSEGEFALYQVGVKKVWLPQTFSPSILGYIHHEIFEQRIYENGLCRIQPGEWVVDAGANVGFFSLYALDQGANVLAFEPVPEIAQALEKTLKDYIAAGRARVFGLGLGSKRGEAEIFISASNSGASTVVPAFRDRSTDGNYRSKSVVIPIETLDRVISDLGIAVSFLKADIEGAEQEMLLGARETIRHYKPRLSICTYHLPSDFREIPRIIHSFEAGYRIQFSGLFDHMYGV